MSRVSTKRPPVPPALGPGRSNSQDPDLRDPTSQGAAAPEGLTVRISREQRDPEWDRFVAGCPQPHHQQTSLWGEVKACYGWQPFRIVVRRGEEILGGVQVLKRNFDRLGWIWHVARGPALASSNPELAEFVLQQLDRAAAKEKPTYLVVQPPYRGEDTKRNFKHAKRRRIQMPGCGVVEIDLDREWAMFPSSNHR